MYSLFCVLRGRGQETEISWIEGYSVFREPLHTHFVGLETRNLALGSVLEAINHTHTQKWGLRGRLIDVYARCRHSSLPGRCSSQNDKNLQADTGSCCHQTHDPINCDVKSKKS